MGWRGGPKGVAETGIYVIPEVVEFNAARDYVQSLQ